MWAGRRDLVSRIHQAHLVEAVRLVRVELWVMVAVPWLEAVSEP